MKTTEAKRLAQKIWGDEYQELLRKKHFDVVDKYALADLALIKKHFALRPGTKFLEIGCGRARLALLLSQLGAEVTGLDISPQAIKLAKEIFQENNLRGRFVVGDTENLPFGERSFDLVFGGGVIEHIANTQKAFGEIYRVLKKNGKLITTIPCLSLTTLPQSFLTGATPQIPVIREINLLIHYRLLKGRYMKYGYEKIYSLNKLREFARKAGFKKIRIEPYLPPYDFKYVPTAFKKIAAQLVRLRGFWPMIGLIGEK